MSTAKSRLRLLSGPCEELVWKTRTKTDLIFGGNLFSEAVGGRHDLVRLLDAQLKSLDLVFEPGLSLPVAVQPEKKYFKVTSLTTF